ncbi:MAG: hypothetical protein HEP71_29645 [Roseivirga sp.]|nr:hypothetical protein [Roseivirga sp.]
MRLFHKTWLLVVIMLLIVAGSCTSGKMLISASGQSSCLNKNGYWYKGKCWAGFEEPGIVATNVDSVVSAQIKAIDLTYVSINNERFAIDFFFPQQEDKETLLIVSFAQLEENIILSFDSKLMEKGDFTAEANYLKGNILEAEDDFQPTAVAAGQLDVSLTEDFDVTIKGVLNNEKGKKFEVEIFANEAVMGAGTSKLEVRGEEAFLSGTLGTITYQQIRDMLSKHPEVHTIVLDQIDGSINDDINMHTGRIVREAGLNTKVLSQSHIASGGVDLFASGVERTVTKGAKLGVHSWAGEDIKGDEMPQDHPAHQYQLAYFTQMLGSVKGPAFYFYTLKSAPAESIYYMTNEEIRQWNLATDWRIK